MWDPYAEFEKTTLPNGLSIYATHWPNRPWERIGFLIHSGASHDPEGLEGVAHFVEHLVSNNTSLTDQEIEKFFSKTGGSVRLGSTSHKFTRYSFLIPIEERIIAESLDLFGKMLLSAKLEKHVERERKIVSEEFTQDFPMEFQNKNLREILSILYPEIWLGRHGSVIGSLNSIEGITKTDLQNFYDKHYTPANISIVGIGGMTLEELALAVSKSTFNIFKTGKRHSLPAPISKPRKPKINNLIYNLSDYFKEKSRTATYKRYTIFPGTIPFQHILILETLLRKKLFESIRLQKNWTYRISTNSEYFRCLSEFFIDCPSLDLKAVDKIEDEVMSCINSLSSDETFLNQEIEEYNKRSKLIDINGDKLLTIVTEELAENQRIETFDEIIKIRNAMTIKDLSGLLEYLRPDNSLSITLLP